MTNPVGRPPGRGKVPGSGRKKGSLDRSARLLIGEQLAFDIVKTYKRLGPDWLLKVAQERPDLFINQCLSKLLPPAFKEDADFVQNNQFNIGNLSDFEAARRVAFVLNAGIHEQQERELVAERVPGTPVAEMTPQEACRADTSDPLPPTYEPAGAPPTRSGFVYDAKDARPYDVQFHAWGLCRDTVENDLSSYHGGGEQQGRSQHRPAVVMKKPTVREIANRRRDLL